MNKIEEMKALVEKLNQYRDAYYNNAESIVTDHQYDDLCDQLEKMEKETGVILSNSPVHSVGYEVKSKLEKIEHSHLMMSLDKTKDVNILRKFIGDKDSLLMCKMDGLTILLTYEDGELIQAETRGNGVTGEIITHNAKAFENIPTNGDRKVTYPGDLVNYNTYGDGSAYPWIDYSGDNLTGNDSQGMMFNGKHYDEYFIIHADQFPENKTDFTICLTIFRAVQRLQNFGMVSNATMMICDYDNPDGDKYEYDLSENENFENLNAVEMGRLYKYGDGFKFQALGSGYTGGMTELFKNFGLDIDEGRD